MSQDSKPAMLIPSWLILIREKAVVLVVILAILLCFVYVLPVPLSRVLVQLGNAAFSAGNDGFGSASYNLALAFNNELNESFKQCDDDKNRARYELAITDCSNVIEIEPNFAAAYFNRGFSYMLTNQYDQAIADFSMDIEIIPAATRSYINRGTVFMKQQKYDAAINDFTKSIEINSKEPQAWLNRGLTYIQQSNNDLAISDCSKAVELEETYWNAYFCLGIAFSNQGKYELAITNFTKATELAPVTNASVIYCMQGVTYTKMGDFESAITSFENGIKIDDTGENDWCKLSLENARQGIVTP